MEWESLIVKTGYRPLKRLVTMNTSNEHAHQPAAAVNNDCYDDRKQSESAQFYQWHLQGNKEDLNQCICLQQNCLHLTVDYPNLGSDCVFKIRSCHPKTQSTFEIYAAAHSNLRLTQLNESLSIFWLQFHQDLNKNWFEQNLLRCHFFIQNVESIVEPDCRTLQSWAHSRICY